MSVTGWGAAFDANAKVRVSHDRLKGGRCTSAKRLVMPRSGLRGMSATPHHL
jgi:hypothetical protein